MGYSDLNETQDRVSSLPGRFFRSKKIKRHWARHGSFNWRASCKCQALHQTTMTAPDGARTLGAKVDCNAVVARAAAGRLLSKGKVRALETKQVSINVGSDGKLLRTPQTWSGSLSECNLQGILWPIFSEKKVCVRFGQIQYSRAVTFRNIHFSVHRLAGWANMLKSYYVTRKWSFGNMSPLVVYCIETDVTCRSQVDAAHAQSREICQIMGLREFGFTILFAHWLIPSSPLRWATRRNKENGKWSWLL